MQQSFPETKPRIGLNRDFLLLALICLAVLGLQWFWLNRLERLPYGDHLTHLNISLDYAQADTWQDFINTIAPTKPPLVHLWTAALYAVMGKSLLTARFSLTFFWLILIPSAFGIGRHLGGKAAGWTAVALCVTSLPLLDLSLTYLPDFPLVSIVALSLYLLLKSRDGSHKSYTLLFGLSLGLGALTKYSFIFFLVFPTLHLYLKALWTSVRKPLNRSLHLGGLTLGLAVLVAWMSLPLPIDSPGWLERNHGSLLTVLVFSLMLLWSLSFWLNLRSRDAGLRPLLHILQALLLAVTVAGPWYLPRLPFYWNDIFYHIVDHSTQAGQMGNNVLAVNLRSCFALLPLFPPLLLLGIMAAYRNKLQAQFYLLLLSPLLSFILISLSLPEELRHIAPMVSMLLPILSLGVLWLNRPLRLAAMLPVFLLCFYLVLPQWNAFYLALTQKPDIFQETYCLMGKRLAQTITRIAQDKPSRVIIVKRNRMFFSDPDMGRFEVDNLNYIFNLHNIDSYSALQPDNPFNLTEIITKKPPNYLTFILLISKSRNFFPVWEKEFNRKGFNLQEVTEIATLNHITAKLYELKDFSND